MPENSLEYFLTGTVGVASVELLTAYAITDQPASAKYRAILRPKSLGKILKR